MASYLIKFLDTEAKYKIVLPTEVVQVGGVEINGFVYDDSNIQTISGSQQYTNDQIALVSGVLQAQIDAIANDTAQEQVFVVTSVSGQDIFTVSGFEFSSSNAVYDVMVFENGNNQIQDAIDFDFKKINQNTIQFHRLLPMDAIVKIRTERTGGGGGGGGGTDLTNIAVNPQPNVNGTKTLGTTAKSWGALYLKDTILSQNYKLEMIAGVLTITPVP